MHGAIRWLTRVSSPAILVAVLLGAAPSVTPAAPVPPAGAVGVTAGPESLLIAGTSTPFVPRGFNSIAVLYPREYADTMCTAVGMDPATRDALAAARASMQDHPDQQLLAMKTHWRANAVRFQISHGALVLEHRTPGPDPYTGAVLSVVRQARAMGLVTIVSLQTQFYGCTPHNPDGTLVKLPGQDAIDAWRQVAPVLAGDRGVLFEIFNEPNSRAACGVESWPLWAFGCDGDPAGVEGMVPLGQAVRAMAADNVLIYDGENNAGRFIDFIPPPGIVANSAYAIHPYFFRLGAPDWDVRFGHLQESGHALVATEWNESGVCTQPSELAAKLVKEYLPARRIGLFVHSWDAPQAVLVDAAADPVDSVTSCPERTGASLAFDSFWSQAGGGDPAPEVRLSAVRFRDGAVDEVTVALADNGTRDASIGPRVARSVHLLVRRGGPGPARLMASMRLDTSSPWTNGSFTTATASGLACRPICARPGDTLIIRVHYAGEGGHRDTAYPIPSNERLTR